MIKSYKKLLKKKGVLKFLEKNFNIKAGKRLEKLFEHKDIIGIDIYNNRHLVVITDKIYFNDNSNYYIGKYAIFIDKHSEYNGDIKIANYGKKALLTSQHICVKSNLRVCWGGVMSEFINNCIRHKSYLPLIYQTIDFIRNPGTSHEYTGLEQLLGYKNSKSNMIFFKYYLRKIINNLY